MAVFERRRSVLELETPLLMKIKEDATLWFVTIDRSKLRDDIPFYSSSVVEKKK